VSKPVKERARRSERLVSPARDFPVPGEKEMNIGSLGVYMTNLMIRMRFGTKCIPIFECIFVC